MPINTRPNRWLIVSAFAVIYLVWGSTFLGIRIAVESIPPLAMAAVRFLVAGVVLLIVVHRPAPVGSVRAEGLFLGATPRQWRNAAIAGALFFLGNHGLITTAAKYIPSGLSCLIVATEVPIIAVLSSVFLQQPPTRRVVIGAATGLLGVLCLFINQGVTGTYAMVLPSLGVLAAAVCWACGAVASQRLDLPSNVLLRSGMQMVCGGLLLSLASLLMNEPSHIQWAAITLRSLLAMAYLIVFGSILAFGCYVWLLNHVRTDAVATHVLINPLVAILLGTWIAGEKFEYAYIIAGALILCSVCIITLGATKTSTAEPPTTEPQATTNPVSE